MPRSFQARLTVAFFAVIALTLVLVTALVLNRLDDYFTRQQETDLALRADTVASFATTLADQAAADAGNQPVVSPTDELNPAVGSALGTRSARAVIADQLGQADVRIEFGLFTRRSGDLVFIPAHQAVQLALQAAPAQGQVREPTSWSTPPRSGGSVFGQYGVRITLSNPYTFRATALANVTGLLGAIALFAMGLSVVVAAGLARRFTTPLRRLTEASRGLAEGDLSRRVPDEEVRDGSSELTELAIQFNAMADRVEESVEMIRRDRDRSRDFLADVSHELRTPLAALHTFNELLKERAGDDPAARAEFLEASGQQIERLDWLAQNLLDLSKLDSGLVLLDLRPDDLRAAVEDAVEQAQAQASKRGVRLVLHGPEAPLRIRHDPQRIGQVVANLVNNAIKFTPRGGSISVEVAPTPDGARIDVADTGVGIDPSELPQIFDRFYRGSQANEARGSGSGLGLAIVRSIVDMHGGTTTVESKLGGGTRFTVALPRDPRLVAGTPAAEQAAVASADSARQGRRGAPMDDPAKVAETSPVETPQVNPELAP